MDIQIQVESTPNPDALKFVVNRSVKTEGKATFTDPLQCYDNFLARELLLIPGVEQVHFFDNVITVSKDEGEWSELEDQIRSILLTRLPVHNPNFKGEVDESDRRRTLSPEIQKIESILDRTIRPGLQGDGGDLEVLGFDNNVLLIRYQGACGSCPSSTAGTLMAMEEILKSEFDPEITIQIA